MAAKVKQLKLGDTVLTNGDIGDALAEALADVSISDYPTQKELVAAFKALLAALKGMNQGNGDSP